MGFIHEVKGEHFGLEERRESFVLLWGGDCEEHGIFVNHQDGISGGMEITFERLRELRELMQHPAIQKVLDEEHTLFEAPPHEFTHHDIRKAYRLEEK